MVQRFKRYKIAEYRILTPVGNIDKLTKAMKLVYEDKKLREMLNKKANMRAQCFSV
jgi:hypothetical protein